MNPEFGRALSDNRIPLIDICFYGQKPDGTWVRVDELFPFDTPQQTIYSHEWKIRNTNGLMYCSWGIDSKIFNMCAYTRDVSHVGNILFLDFDGNVDFESLLRRIAYLQRDGLIKTNPDIARSGHGYHVYVYEKFDFSKIKKILLKDYIYFSVCDSFLRTTLKLKCSVLRLGLWKKGNFQPIKLIERGFTSDETGKLYMDFVRRMLDENSF